MQTGKEPSWENFMKEFGWVGLVIGLLASNGGASAVINFLEGLLSGGDASLESAITVGKVFLQTLGLLLGVLLCTFIHLKVPGWGMGKVIIFVIVLGLAAIFANEIGVGQNIPIPQTSDWRVFLMKLVEVYLSLYGILISAAAVIIGLFFGRWAHLITQD